MASPSTLRQKPHAPPDGEAITMRDGRLQVPAQPIIPFIEGDGTGPDIWRASVRVPFGAGEIVDPLVFAEASVDGAVTDRGGREFILTADVVFAFDKATLTGRMPRAAGSRRDVLEGLQAPLPPHLHEGGIEPAGLFLSRDCGTTWQSVEALNQHPTARTWQPAGGSLIGLLLLSAVVCIVLGINRGPVWGWDSGRVLGLFALAAVALSVFAVVERRVRVPMVDFSFFASRTFLGANIVAFIVSFAMLGMFFFMALYIQNILGYSPLEAGVRLVPHAAAMMIVAPMSARFVERLGSRYVMFFSANRPDAPDPNNPECVGRAVAVLFAREGADVAIVYLKAEQRDAEETRDAVQREGRNCLLIPGDVRSSAFCRRAVERTAKQLGGLDILVNNAAYQQHQESLEEISDEQWDRTFRTNIHGYFYMAKAALAHLREGGAIVNCGSITGLEGNKTLIDYASTTFLEARFLMWIVNAVFTYRIIVEFVSVLALPRWYRREQGKSSAMSLTELDENDASLMADVLGMEINQARKLVRSVKVVVAFWLLATYIPDLVLEATGFTVVWWLISRIAWFGLGAATRADRLTLRCRRSPQKVCSSPGKAPDATSAA